MKLHKILIIFLCFSLITIIYLHKGGKSITLKKEKEDPSPEVIIKETDLYLFCKEKIKRCKIKAKESQIFTEKNETVCKKITCKIKTDSNIVAKMRAKIAHIYHKTKSVFFPGNVECFFKNWYINKKNTLYNSQNQTIKSENTKISMGKKIYIESNESLINIENESFHLKNGVFSQFNGIIKHQ